MKPFAEVIGDPIGHSKSPAIHRHWLGKLGIEGDYRAVRVERDGLPAYLDSRRNDADWRGCNVTIPHKERVGELIDHISADAEAIGAINCVVCEKGRLVGYNSDVGGIAAALGGKPLGSRKVAVIGAGGAARAMLAYLSGRALAGITIIARDPRKARSLGSVDPAAEMKFASLDQASTALEGSALIVNASPLGMRGAAPMPEELLAAVESHARGTILFDMVYEPRVTDFLRRGVESGGEPVDGLTMLVGQARSAFERFYGKEPPAGDAELRKLLTRGAGPETSKRSE